MSMSNICVLSSVHVALMDHVQEDVNRVQHRHTDIELNAPWLTSREWSFSDMQSEEADIFKFRDNANVLARLREEVKTREEWWISLNVMRSVLRLDDFDGEDDWERRVFETTLEKERFRRLVCGCDFRQEFSGLFGDLRRHLTYMMYKKFLSLAESGGFAESEVVRRIKLQHSAFFDEHEEEGGEEEERTQDELEDSDSDWRGQDGSA